ncbi:MAG: ferrochelatase [Acidimicrobiales bacterium]
MSEVDAVLILSFGGPEGPDEVVLFLERVTAGRGIPGPDWPRSAPTTSTSAASARSTSSPSAFGGRSARSSTPGAVRCPSTGATGTGIL